jgi:hypothetical protein
MTNTTKHLVKQVALAISQCEDPEQWDDEMVAWTPEARIAIRKVATWLSEAPLDVYQDERSIMVNALLDEANR